MRTMSGSEVRRKLHIHACVHTYIALYTRTSDQIFCRDAVNCRIALGWVSDNFYMTKHAKRELYLARSNMLKCRTGVRDNIIFLPACTVLTIVFYSVAYMADRLYYVPFVLLPSRLCYTLNAFREINSSSCREYLNTVSSPRNSEYILSKVPAKDFFFSGKKSPRFLIYYTMYGLVYLYGIYIEGVGIDFPLRKILFRIKPLMLILTTNPHWSFSSDYSFSLSFCFIFTEFLMQLIRYLVLLNSLILILFGKIHVMWIYPSVYFRLVCPYFTHKR